MGDGGGGGDGGGSTGGDISGMSGMPDGAIGNAPGGGGVTGGGAPAGGIGGSGPGGGGTDGIVGLGNQGIAVDAPTGVATGGGNTPSAPSAPDGLADAANQGIAVDAGQAADPATGLPAGSLGTSPSSDPGEVGQADVAASQAAVESANSMTSLGFNTEAALLTGSTVMSLTGNPIAGALATIGGGVLGGSDFGDSTGGASPGGGEGGGPDMPEGGSPSPSTPEPEPEPEAEPTPDLPEPVIDEPIDEPDIATLLEEANKKRQDILQQARRRVGYLSTLLTSDLGQASVFKPTLY